MKKIYSFFFVFLLALSANAQLTTNSNNDANGKAAVSDATETVDATILNSVLKAIDDKLQKMSDRLTAIEVKVGIGEESEDDPYNGHAYVDLGTGVKWATMNVGASSPDDYGHYFAWGATKPQSVYDWVNTLYQTQNTTDWSSTKFTKYLGSTTSSYKDSSATDANAKKTVLDPEDDAAHKNWGGNWRMPTKAEQDALRSQCYWQWVTSYNGKSVIGYIVYKAKADADKGKYSTSYSPSASYTVSDPHIFLPSAGYRNGSDLGSAGADGCYWSSSLDESSPYNAYGLYFDSGYGYWDKGRRYRGRCVRAVCQ